MKAYLILRLLGRELQDFAAAILLARQGHYVHHLPNQMDERDARGCRSVITTCWLGSV